jgi:uracil-DNA glycosylase
MNPSHVRFPEHEFAFGGREGSPGPGQKFNILLRESKLLDKIYVDNLIHCSSVDNNIKSSWAQACFVYLVETIRVLKPIKIITMGRQVFEILNSLLAENNIRIDMSNIWHPSYVFSYRRSTPEEYKNMILNTCKEKL